MAGRYQAVPSPFWRRPDVRGWNDRQRLAALYLLTNPLRASEGLYFLPVAVAASDLGWKQDEVVDVVESLGEAFRYDLAAEVVLLADALRDHPPTGAKSIAGAVNAALTVPECGLLNVFLALADKYAPGFARALRERLGRPQPDGDGVGW